MIDERREPLDDADHAAIARYIDVWLGIEWQGTKGTALIIAVLAWVPGAWLAAMAEAIYGWEASPLRSLSFALLFDALSVAAWFAWWPIKQDRRRREARLQIAGEDEPRHARVKRITCTDAVQIFYTSSADRPPQHSCWLLQVAPGKLMIYNPETVIETPAGFPSTAFEEHWPEHGSLQPLRVVLAGEPIDARHHVLEPWTYFRPGENSFIDGSLEDIEAAIAPHLTRSPEADR